MALVLISLAVAGCGKTVDGLAQPDPAAINARSGSPTTGSTVEGPVPLAQLEGTWIGTYICAQGETALTLTIERAVNSTARTVFAFGPTTGNPTVPNGSFDMDTRYVDRQLHFTQRSWIERPGNYLMIDLAADAVAEGSISGKVVATAGCTTFSVTRSGV
ncbi:hypothetical protein [Nocardia huaxiensis]|uniref:Lipocalin-like domain-containing protein n=1 Tax=Nocardia huaxiensis TaxID=2755382 RepID=A0A7D6ZFW5_9NOCA|nr:hypothetical protein [Nocardia huaxiensis]QLY29959.1 hypothetical protein H0264_32925 [Nocardia huaxiensis]UFS96456.1 hypothetical protein LPY97_00475 [Nocardia huaxiensis]